MADGRGAPINRGRRWADRRTGSGREGGGRGPDPRVGERRAARAAGGKREGEKGRGGSVEASISCERGGQVRSQSKAVAVVKRKPIRLNFFLISDPKAKPLQ
jgi:hypothetical protein